MPFFTPYPDPMTGAARLLLFPVMLLFFGLRCDQPPTALAARARVERWPPARELMRTFRERGRLLVVVGTGDPACAAAYRTWAEQLRGGRGRMSVEVRPDTAVSAEELAQEAVLLLGAPAGNAVLARTLPRLPLQVREAYLEFGGHRFDDTSAVFSLNFFPSPYNRQLPLMLITGRSDAAVLATLQPAGEAPVWSPFGGGNWGYGVYRQGRRILLGAFDDATWQPDPARRFDFTAAPELVRVSPHYRFIAHHFRPDTADLRRLASGAEAALARIEAFTGRALAGPPLPHHLYGSPEEKGLMLNNTRQSHADLGAGEIHSVLNDNYREHQAGADNQLVLRRLLGAPRTALLERGLAVWFTEGWQRRGYAFWARRLHRSGNRRPLAELLDAEGAPDRSTLISDCLSASFVAFLIDSWGREGFLSRYAGWAPAPAEIAALDAGWRAYLDRQADTATPAPARPPLPFLRGFNFTHEGYQIYNGYGSRLAGQALSRLEALHANAVAVVPYSWMSDPRQPAPLPVADGPGSETDEAVVQTLADARARGMITMLKPQLWLGGGSWPGDVAMPSEADWQRWFDAYRQWIVHYALLAEIHGADLLCVGTELVRTTLEREADWRALITSIRGVYSGPVTYAANWGEEFERLPFWDALDYAGLDCYYPLSDDPAAGDEALRARFAETCRRVSAVAQRAGRPLLLTEVGFSSVDHPWTQPHSDGYDRAYNEEHQARCYEVVLSELNNHPLLKGVFWWKWPTDPGHRGRREGKGFPINDKQAEAVVQHWYGRWAAGR